MAIFSKIRKWIYPSKQDNFDQSYDYLVTFFNTLDREFGGTLEFLLGRRVDKIFLTEDEAIFNIGVLDQSAFIMTTGDIWVNNGAKWEKTVDRIGTLPKVSFKDPTKGDSAYKEGDTWVNRLSGEVFKFIGSVKVGENPNGTAIKEAIWVSSTGRVPYDNSFVNYFVFYPNVDFNYVTKTLHVDSEGVKSFEDSDPHMKGSFGDDSIGKYLNHDTHMDLFVGTTYFGTLVLNREKVMSLMDMEVFKPEGGLPSKDEWEINAWYERFERTLGLLNSMSITPNDFKNILNMKTKFPKTIPEYIESEAFYTEFYTTNNFPVITELQMGEIKEKYRSFFSGLLDIQVTNAQKLYHIYLLGLCVPYSAYDGNIYHINGQAIVADGNIEPSCG